MISDYNAEFDFTGIIDESIRFIEDFSLTDNVLWDRFVNQFTVRTDSENAAWRGEYWGKMMRGACFTYSYTKNPELYKALEKTIREMIGVSDEYGRISTYTLETEFDGWDMWCRKYVLLGMQYFIEICEDESLISDIIDSMCKQADYIISKIGTGEGKKEITMATRHWRGANSASILEPVVRLYKLTDKKEYLDFAEYIVSTGATDVENLFELAYENKLYPYQYPITKAYEVTSCFEGLLEYYTVTGIEKHKTAIINYADRILESDFTIIGSSGCTHEMFDHSTARQANTTNINIMQETCVTVTLMKFFYRLNMLTGDSKYADAFEIAMYNAFLGSINTNKSIESSITDEFEDAIIEPLPFDSYSPLTAGTRGNGIGGLQLMSDKHYYGCCACIGSMGTGLIPKMAVMSGKDGIVINLYINGQIKTRTPYGDSLTITTRTDYPKDGKIEITFETPTDKPFEVKLRNPLWNEKTSLILNNTEIDITSGYITIQASDASKIVMEMDMRTEAIKPTPYGSEVLMTKVVWGHNYIVPVYDEEDVLAKRHIALRRGPITLAIENRLGHNVDEPLDVKINDDGYVAAFIPKTAIAPYKNIVELELPRKCGKSFTVTDYASAGKLWTEESKMAAWILTE